MKINPFLNKRFCGMEVTNWLSILCGVIVADTTTSCFNITSKVIEFVVWIVAWILGSFLYYVVIAAIKTFITKED